MACARRDNEENGNYSRMAVCAVRCPQRASGRVRFPERALRQGAGEASVTLRNDGSAGLLFLEPGSLGNNRADLADRGIPRAQRRAGSR